ncbi:MAG: efflux RND transporter permease subunit, partial [Methyloceanibacter sp.]
ATGAGAAARVSVGLTVFGGMLVATILGVVFVPFLYVQFQRLREAVKRGKKAESAPKPLKTQHT